MPPAFAEMSASWRYKHPHWKHILWTDEMNLDFIRNEFPFFLQQYLEYPTNIQRVDAVRYFLLYKYGGVYVDLDFECKENITPLISNASCIFGREPEEHCRTHDRDLIISNAFMAASPGHPFIRALCNRLSTVTSIAEDNIQITLDTTGPFMLSDLYQAYTKKEEVDLLDSSLLYPYTKKELLDYAKRRSYDTQRLGKVYAIHHYAGTWWKQHDSQL